MDNNPYNIFCILFTSISILWIFLLCKKYVKDSNNKYRIPLWSGVIVYTALLPYTMLAFNFVSGRSSALLLKKIPVIATAILFLVYFCVSKKYMLFLRKSALVTILIGIAVCAAIFLLQSNANKQIHVSQYFLLSYLIYKGAKLDYKGKGLCIYVWYCATFLAVLDELFQGIHNNRYFSMKDVLTDTASSLGAVIFISTGKTSLKTGITIANSKISYFSFFKGMISNIFRKSSLRYHIPGVFISGIVTFCNLVLFHLDSTGKGDYRLNFKIAGIIFSILILILLYKVVAGLISRSFSIEHFMFLFTPLTVFLIINLSLIAVNTLKIKFL